MFAVQSAYQKQFLHNLSVAQYRIVTKKSTIIRRRHNKVTCFVINLMHVQLESSDGNPLKSLCKEIHIYEVVSVKPRGFFGLFTKKAFLTNRMKTQKLQ